MGVVNEKNNTMGGFDVLKQDIYNTTHNLISDKIEVNTGKNYLGRITIGIIDQSIFKEV